ncbi:hypothetical protein PS2_036411 [Malus domestica]
MADHQELMQQFHTVKLKLTFEYCECKGCEGKVRKQMKKVDGIYEKSLTIDKEQGAGTLIVSGRFDKDKLIMKLLRSKKLREVDNMSVENETHIFVMVTTKPEELNRPMMMIVAVDDLGPRGMKVKGPNKKQDGKKDKGGEYTSNAKTTGVPMGGYPMHPTVPETMGFGNPYNQQQPYMPAMMMGERVAYWNCIYLPPPPPPHYIPIPKTLTLAPFEENSSRAGIFLYRLRLRSLVKILVFVQ